jgi:hypothetical protein
MRPIRATTAATAAALAAAVALAAAPAARAGGGPGACYRALDARGVAWTHADRPGIDLGVEVEGPLGGVTYQAFSGKPLVLDCSLVVSLAEAGPYFVALGIDRVTFSSAYQVRNVRGTRRRSKHSFGLAIDVHTFHGPELGTVNVERDFEQGLGDAADCVGQPLTQGGAVLKRLECQLVASGLFDLVLNPDYDSDHYNHFHLQARRWRDRDELHAERRALYR